MSIRMPWLPAFLVLTVLVFPRLPAIQMQELTLISPITGNSFPAVGVPPNLPSGDTLADMGADDDGCRHSSGANEYDYYVATDPTSYFSALTWDWDEKTGRFLFPLAPDFKQWVEKEFNSELQVDLNNRFQTIIALNKQRGLPPPDRKEYMLSQQDIPIEKRYRMALKCYAKRGARSAALAKIALMGAWAIRTRLNLPVTNQALAGGYEEVNDKVVRLIKDGETFSLAKWLPVYRDIFDNVHLTNEGYLVAGMVYLGFSLREGTLATSQGVVKKLTDRMKDVEKGEMLRGLARERTRMLSEYLSLLNTAVSNFIDAIASEEFTRQHLPEIMLGVAEGLRRTGDLARAMDWYLALAKISETQPKLRDEIRGQGKAPGPEASYLVGIGWTADLYIAALTKSGLVHPGVPSGQDKRLLDAIVFENLGSSEYQNPNWKAITTGTQADCALLLDAIGKAVMDFAFRKQSWPKNLGELWDYGVVRDRNYLNRFCCPVSGKPFLYQELPGDVSTTSPKTIILATPTTVKTIQGDRYGGFLANLTLVWSANPLTPGEVFNQPGK